MKKKHLIQIYSNVSPHYSHWAPVIKSINDFLLPCSQWTSFSHSIKKKTNRTTFGACNQNRKLTKETFVHFRVVIWREHDSCSPFINLTFLSVVSLFLFLLLPKFTFLFHFYLSILSFFFLSFFLLYVSVICIRLADLQLLIALSVPVCCWFSFSLCYFSFHFCSIACSTILIIFMSFKNIKFFRQQ